MKNILITGATGQLGNAVVNFLLSKKYPVSLIHALVRDEIKASVLKDKGIDIRVGDYNNVESVQTALKGIDIVMFVSANDLVHRTQQHEYVMKAINASDVKHVVYTSFVNKENSGPSPIAFITDAHIKTEQWLKESGKKYTVLRNNLYLEYVPVYIGEKVLETGVFFPAGEGKTAGATREEMAEVAANVLISPDKHENRAYNISNNESFTYAEVAETIASVSGKPVSYYSPSQEEYKQMLAGAGVPEGFITLLAAFGEAIKRNEFDTPGTDLETLLGRKPLSLKAFFQQVYSK